MSNNLSKWLYPGIKVKRWVLISLFGILVVGIGSSFFVSPYPFVRAFATIIVVCGMVFIVLGMGKMTVSLITLFLPQRERDIVNILYQKRYLERGPKIVAIGGGHGLSNLLFGLKEYLPHQCYCEWRRILILYCQSYQPY